MSAVFRFLKSKIQRRIALLTLVSMLGSFVAPAAVYAAASITAATGGSAIGNSTAGGAFTSLTGPIITESAIGEVGAGTIILTAPTGFEFNTAGTVTLTVTAGTCGTGNPVQLTGGMSSEAVTPTASSITMTVTAASSGDADCASTLTYTGLEVRPTASSPLATGNLTVSGTATITGVSGTTNFGTLTEVDDTKPTITLTGASPQEIEIGNAYTELGATAADDIDGDITVSIVIDASAVDTNTIGSYSVTYNVSDAAGNAATEATRTVDVVKKTTTTALASDLNPSIIADNVTFTATVTGFSPTGSVEFYSGTTLLSTETLSAGQATFSTTSLVVGTSMITASYLGDSQNNTSTSTPALQQVVNQSPTSTATLSAPDPSVVGSDVTFTVTVTGVGPTGNVEFYSGTTLLGTSAVSAVNATTSEATLTINTLGVGTYTIRGQYLGDTNNEASSTNTVDMHVVEKGPSTTSTLSGPSNPTLAGDNINFNVTVQGVVPFNVVATSGTVDIFSGTTLLGTTAIHSVNNPLKQAYATFTINTLPVGSYTVHAVYSGNAEHNPSTTNAIVVHVVDPANSTTTALSTPNSSIVGDTVTFTANITGFNPTGTVQFLSGAHVLGSSTLANTTATTADATFQTDQLVPAGNYTITASYLGDANNNPSVSTPAILQVVDKKATTSTLISNPNSSIVGNTVTFTSEVNGFNPTGTVQFLSGTHVLGSSTLMDLTAASGTAVFATNQLVPAGNYSITASYLGDLNNLPSASSPALIQVVEKKQSVTTLTSTPNPAKRTDIIVFSINVSGFQPTGTVTLTSNEKIIDQGTIDGSGNVEFELDPTDVGFFRIVASYSGDLNNHPSESDTLIQQIIGGAQSSRRRFYKLVRSLSEEANVGFAIAENAVDPTDVGGPAGGVSSADMNILCAAHAKIYEQNALHVIDYMAQVYAHALSLPEILVKDVFQNPLACSNTTAQEEVEKEDGMSAKLKEQKSLIALATQRIRQKFYGETIAFPVDEQGIPVSSNDIWNACIRHQQVFMEGSHRPVNCRRFHKGHTWTHPDLNISFVWSDRYMNQLRIRHNYLVVTVPTPKYLVKRQVKLTHISTPGRPEAHF